MERSCGHQYVDRRSGRIVAETLIADRLVGWLYGAAREKAPLLFKALTSARGSQLLSYVNFDCPVKRRPSSTRKLAAALNVDLQECVSPYASLQSARNLFERQIRFWQCRPMPRDPSVVVSPADAKILVGSLNKTDALFLKEKFFTYDELLGPAKRRWREAFLGGDFAVLRLTPEKYHYNHLPVSGRVVDFYTLDGTYHSCNPAAVVATATPYSKNKRVVTIIDTDIGGGTGIGLVAMVEIVALMIGEIVQCYSSRGYERPQPIARGRFVHRGQPKSLFRPGSSVDVLFFQKGRIRFDPDLIRNCRRSDVHSRFTIGFQRPVVETDVQVRSSIAGRKQGVKRTDNAK
jgi:phosphatidylserine decarboxylase